MAPETHRCPNCLSTVTSVVIALDGRVVTMRSCNGCDRRWWSADGEDVDPVELFTKTSA